MDLLWQLWIDTGGTFTDCLAEDPAGGLHRAKVLSSAALRARVLEVQAPRTLRLDADWGLPDRFFVGGRLRTMGPATAETPVIDSTADGLVEVAEGLPSTLESGAGCELVAQLEAPLLAAHVVTRTPLAETLPPMRVRLASTRGTNALLERRGAATALFITRGFGDLLAIGSQQRPELFALEIVKPEPLYAAVVEVPERLAADGEVVEPIDLEAIRARAEELVAGGVRSAAVALMHSWRDPSHELALAELLSSAGFRDVSCSAELAPLIRLLPRAETAVVDAYLAPIIGDYLDCVDRAMTGGGLHVMSSAGGLMRAADVRPKDTLLSGPAGGVVGAAMAARRSGFDRVIAFDMGGTSTDVARWDGDFEYLYEHRVGDARLLAPALAIESVAAGGGSVCRFDGRSLRVGPESAGADPGPACYGAGGPLTVTDLDLLLGRIEADRFQLPVKVAAAEEALEKVRAELEKQTGELIEPEVLAEGFLRIADERMAAAIRRVSLRRGYDPADYPLLGFGGAGPQHACAVASLLGIRTVLVPADAGLLSAAGVGAALIERFAQRQVLQPLEETEERIPGLLAGLAEEARSAVAAEGVDPAEIVIRRRVAAIRLAGQESTLELEWREGIALGTAFSEHYRRVYGYDPPPRSLELESLRAVASVRPPSEAAAEAVEAFRTAPPLGSRQVRFAGAARDTGIHDRPRLRSGDRLDGPALVTERHSVTVVAPGWRLEVDAAGALLLRRDRDEAADLEPDSTAVQLELFSHRLQAIARDMGELLKRTALSVNIKERMDFSCAVLDAHGRLVVNAPHIPVHLGALGLCVRRLMEELSFEAGDTVVTNHPAYGGSHLPDITAVTPVFLDGRRLGFVANRAHHAEIGGSRPGSLPPDARCLAEEGVVIPPMYLLRGAEPRWQAVERLLRDAPFPSRAVAENLADLEAAVAANRLGALALEELARRHGADTVAAHMRGLAERAATALGNAFERLDDGRHAAVERLDDGTRLQVAVSVTGRRARVDFSGTAGVHPGNLNATPAVVHGVVLYVLRLLVDEPLPLNEGLLEVVELVIPEGLLNPRFPDDSRRAPAVVGGNVETSQRLVDLLLKALRLAACSQGTMNNLVFGDGSFGYYETVAGGAGAGPDFAGCDAVHSHMTNTRATDPELLEHRYPVRLERFAIRRGSGGAGRRRGGDGVIRELRFLRPVSLSLLGQHRIAGPYGMAGGQPGQPGRQRLERSAGELVELAGIDGCEAGTGDRLILETPGGGGWGRPDTEDT